MDLQRVSSCLRFLWELLFLLVTSEERQRERNRFLFYFPKAKLGCPNVPTVSSSTPQGHDELGSFESCTEFHGAYVP